MLAAADAVLSPLNLVKNEVHNIIQILQLTQYTSPRRFSREVLSAHDPPLIKKFRSLLKSLSAVDEFETTPTTLQPFLDVIRDHHTPIPITTVVLAAVNKFVSYNLIRIDRTSAPDCINNIADAIIHCRFQATNTLSDQVVHLKILTVLIDIINSPAGDFLDDSNLWGMIKKAYSISRQAHNSSLLSSLCENTLQQITLKIFSTCKHRNHSPPNTTTTKSSSKFGAPYGELTVCRLLRFSAYLASFGAYKKEHSSGRVTVHGPVAIGSSCGGGKDETAVETELTNLGRGYESMETEAYRMELRILGLTLINVALETAGESLSNSSRLTLVVQEHVCKALLLNADTESLIVLSMSLRCIFNLFMYLKRHLKVQLEMFFNSLHLQIAVESTTNQPSGRRSKTEQARHLLFICERKELALESLLEFCREPDLILELYENYDCDLRCTNLFENLVKTLTAIATPTVNVKPLVVPKKAVEHLSNFLSYIVSAPEVYESLLFIHRPALPFRKSLGRVTALHRLALAGLYAVCQNLAFRCVWDIREPYLRPETSADEASNVTGVSGEMDWSQEGDEAKLESLKQQRNQKKRLAAAAQMFNTEPGECVKRMQSLGLMSDPPDPQRMAEFLRTTARLDLRVIGEYLAKPGEWTAAVRSAFASQMSFQGLPVVEALRRFLKAFRLPGEAQQIERILETFATHYFIQQPQVMQPSTDKHSSDDNEKPLPHQDSRWIISENDSGPPELTPPISQWHTRTATEPPTPDVTIFKSSDTVFVLAYSIILLNTDLHNPQVKKKMSIEDFIRNNRGINDNQDLPSQYLTTIYTSIKEREIAIVAGGQDTSTYVEHMVENSEHWDYLLCNPDFLGSYSKALTAAQLRTPMQAFHQKAMFLTLWEDAKILTTLATVLISTRDPEVAVECVEAIGELIRISTFYKLKHAVTDLAVTVLKFAQPLFSFKSQLIIPLILHLFTLGWHQLDFTGWLVYSEFLVRLGLIGLLPSPLTDFERFPIAPRDQAALLSAFEKDLAIQPPAQIETLSKLQQLQLGTWLSDFTALWWSTPESGNLESPESFGSDDSDAEDNFVLTVKENKAPFSVHQKALETSIQFWTNCSFFPNSLSLDKDIPKIPCSDLWTARESYDAFKQIFSARCHFEDLYVGRLLALSETSLHDLISVTLIRILPPHIEATPTRSVSVPISRPEKPAQAASAPNLLGSEDPQFAQTPPQNATSLKLPPGLSKLRAALETLDQTNSISLIDDNCIRYSFRRDDAPLLSMTKCGVGNFRQNFVPATSLEIMTQVLLVLEKRRQEGEMECLFFDGWLQFCRVLEGLLRRFVGPSEGAAISDLKEKSIEDIVGPSRQTAAPLSATGLLLSDIADAVLEEAGEVTSGSLEGEMDEETVAFFVERLTIAALKLCISLGHHSDIRIVGPLVKFFDMICRLKDIHFYRLFFQISAAVSLLLNTAVYGNGLQKVEADSVYVSKSHLSLSPFFMSLLDLMQRVSPYYLFLNARRPDAPRICRNQTLQVQMSQSGGELLCSMATSGDFHGVLQRLMRRACRERDASFCVPYFTRLLVQTFLLYSLSFNASEFTAEQFDLEETPTPLGPSVSASAEVLGASSCSPSSEIISLLPRIYSGVTTRDEQNQQLHNEGMTPSTNDADSTDLDGDSEDFWDLWAPIAQALAIVSAFGTRKQRRPAMMQLQHHLNCMPLVNPATDSSAVPTPSAARISLDARRWTETVELVLFPLMSQNFIYPFPSSVTKSHDHNIPHSNLKQTAPPEATPVAQAIPTPLGAPVAAPAAAPAPEVPIATAPEVPIAAAPEVPIAAAPEVPIAAAPAPEVPIAAAPAAAPEAPIAAAPEVPIAAAPEVPEIAFGGRVGHQGNQLMLGQALKVLFPDYQLVLCRIPREEPTKLLIDPSRSNFGILPAHILIQRKAQSVGFVCRAILGKLPLLFEPIDTDSYNCSLLFPIVIRIFRIFLHEMTTPNVAMYDAIVEAAKNFLLVLATAPQLKTLTQHETDYILERMVEQPADSLVSRNLAEVNERKLESVPDVWKAYSAAFDKYTEYLSTEQTNLFCVVYYLLRLAGRTGILGAVFEVLVVSSTRQCSSPKN